MAYTSSTLDVMPQAIGGSKRIWTYRTTDLSSIISVSSYVSDATKKGLLEGDFIIAGSSDQTFGFNVQTVRSSLSTGSADLSGGTLISS